MLVLVPDPTYPDQEELYDEFRNELAKSIREEFADSAVFAEVDAGPSASIPAFFIDLTSFVADAATVLTLPLVAREAFKAWHSKFNSAVAFLEKLGLRYSIDLRSAAVLAAGYLLNKVDDEPAVEVHAVTRHWMNLGGAGAEFISPDELNSILPDAPLDRHFAAVKQLSAHYVLLVSTGTRAFTVIVKNDGSVVHIDEI